MSTTKYPVFVDDLGNRFIFPGYYDTEEVTLTSWSSNQMYSFALGLNVEKEPMVVTVDESGGMHFPHVKAEVTHPSFERYVEPVLVIGGPTFDQALAAFEEGYNKTLN